MGGKRRPGLTSRKKPYKKPVLKQLSPEEAEEILKTKSIPGDPQTEKLLNEIRRIQSKE